jgi:DNA-binding beta-propeller fold protein YncE
VITGTTPVLFSTLASGVTNSLLFDNKTSNLYHTSGTNLNIIKNTGSITLLTGVLNTSSESIAINPTTGILYLSQRANNNIITINPTTKLLTNFAGTGTVGSANGNALASTFTKPSGIAFNAASNILYLVDGESTGRIRSIDLATNIVSTSKTGLNSPEAVGVSPEGNTVYATNSGNHTIVAGDLIYGLAGSTGSTDGAYSNARFNNPRHLIVHPINGLIYVSDVGNSRVRIIDPIEKIVYTLRDNLSNAFIFTGLSAIAINPSTNVLYVAHGDVIKAVNTPLIILNKSVDISGWIYTTLSNLSSNVNRNINIMNSNMYQLDYEYMTAYMMNKTNILLNLGNTYELTRIMSSNFINLSLLNTYQILNSNLALSNIIAQSNTFITSNLAILISTFNRDYSNVSSNILVNIREEYNKFTTHFATVTRSLQYINSNMNTAYTTMRTSNYSGKYSYYYDHVSAMLGRNSNILTMANTSNYRKDIISPSPTMYERDLLYDNSGDIILSSEMYSYISDRYIGSNYNSLSNQFIKIYNIAKSTPNSNRFILSTLQACNANFMIDSMQLTKYSNTLSEDANTATGVGLREYIIKQKTITDAIDNPVVKSNIAGDLSKLYTKKIKPVAEKLMTDIETVLSQTEKEIYFFRPADLNNLKTIRGNLKQYYLKADFINNNNGRYFQNTFQNSNGVRGNYFFINNLETVSIAGLYASNDYNDLMIMVDAPEFTNIINSFQIATINARDSMKENINGILSHIDFMYNSTLKTTNFVINRTNSDIQKLRAYRLDGRCFTLYPTIVSASNQLNTILNVSLPRLYGQYNNALNTYTTINSLSNLHTISQSLLYTSNHLYNNYLTASNLSNTFAGVADKLINTISTTYGKYPQEIVLQLPIFTGCNCR